MNRTDVTKLLLPMFLIASLGACGEDGAAGPPGPPGPAGPAGSDGSEGPAGPAGMDGMDGENGTDGEDGMDGQDGMDGANGLVQQTALGIGDENCFQGGVRVDSGLDDDGDGLLSGAEVRSTSYLCAPTRLNDQKSFVRIASYPVCQLLDPTCDTDTETAAEIVDVSTDGNTLVFSDSPNEAVGFVDISDPAAPTGTATIALTGEPTSVAVVGDLVLVGVNTSTDFVNVSGELVVIDVATRTTVATLTLPGQPDSVAVSPDGTYAAVAIENERDEDLNDGELPQLPAGALATIDLGNPDPTTWTVSTVPLTGLADFEPTDPEPEYVDINEDGVAAVSLQENNHIVLVDLAAGMVVGDFSAGTVDLLQVDATEEEPARILQTETLTDIPREPDGLAWINRRYLATADEGDLNGGSRGFTVFDTLLGNVAYTSGSDLDLLAARVGHYPDARSGNKGNEPENAEVGIFGSDRYLFVNSERSSLIFVYDVADPTRPVLKQILPAAAAPEGVKAIPGRNLLVAASEEDSRDDKIRSAINIYRYGFGEPTYPTLQSASRPDGTPIPWSAMSGLAASPTDPSILYAIEDSFYGANRIFVIDVSERPATLTREITITDPDGVFAAFPTSGATADPDTFDAVDLDAMINADGTVNLDPEGIAVASDGGFWIASEGAGTIGDTANRPIEKLNFIFKTDAEGVIEDVLTLPDAVNAIQVRFGFEGIAEWDGRAHVVIQRAWGAEANPRIGIFDVVAGTWTFVFYPLDTPTSQNGGWVGLSDITSIGGGQFLVLERDNQGGPDAAIKRLYAIDLSAPVPDATITKTLVRDLILSGDLAQTGGLTPEKLEGSALTVDGDVWIINDNDGVDDNSGETQLLDLGPILLAD